MAANFVLGKYIRLVIYSYLDFKSLSTKISKLNSYERELLAHSELLIG
jgi:hypothetical protein